MNWNASCLYQHFRLILAVFFYVLTAYLSKHGFSNLKQSTANIIIALINLLSLKKRGRSQKLNIVRDTHESNNDMKHPYNRSLLDNQLNDEALRIAFFRYNLTLKVYSPMWVPSESDWDHSFRRNTRNKWALTITSIAQN